MLDRKVATLVILILSAVHTLVSLVMLSCCMKKSKDMSKNGRMGQGFAWFISLCICGAILALSAIEYQEMMKDDDKQ